MGYYKIKNITNTLAKRHPNKNSAVKISLHDGLKKSEYEISSGEEIAMECQTIPVDLQKLRIKGHVTIVEMSKNNFLSQLKESQKPEQSEEKEEKSSKKKSTTTSSTKSTTRKSSTKKSSSRKKSTTTTTTEAPESES